jgi:hypothetical protein
MTLSPSGKKFTGIPVVPKKEQRYAGDFMFGLM